jgi:AcrR family transcriptional regulator
VSTASRPRARKGEGDRLRDEILDATQALLAEEGSAAAVSIRAVARRVGVTPPSIYLHFADKDDLMFQCCRRGFEALEARMRDASAGVADPAERLRRMGRAYVEFGVANGEQYRVIFDADPASSTHLAAGEDLPGVRAFELLVETVAEGAAAGVLRDDLEPAAIAVAVWSAVHGAVLILLAGHGEALPIPGRDALIGAVLGVVEAGIVAA